jgi:hypothetical protein
MEALERFRVPPYLVRLIRSYLNDRWIAYTGRNGWIRSRVLYGAPIWAGDLMANRRCLTLQSRLHRTTAIRIARGYRTISHASASVLAASLPFELQALALQQVYDHLRDQGSGDGGTQTTNCDQPVQDVRRQAKQRTWERWRSQLLEEDTTRPHRAVRAILPNWEAWRDRGGVPLKYRMTQVLTQVLTACSGST